MFRQRPIGSYLKSILNQASRRVWLASPFLTAVGAELVRSSSSLPYRGDFRLITRLNDRDVLARVLDLDAVASLIESGAVARVRDASFHAKVFIVDDLAIVGSGNLTSGGLYDNDEAAVVVDARGPADWFDELWRSRATKALSPDALRRIQAELSAIAPVANPDLPPLRDFALELPSDSRRSTPPPGSRYGWLKLNGVSSGAGQVRWDYFSFEEGRSAGAQCFGQASRPNLETGDVVYLAMLYRTRHGGSGRALYGRGMVDTPHRPEIDIMPPEIRSDPAIVNAGANQWPRIVWLRDVLIAQGRMEDLPQLSDIVDAEGHPALDSARFRQGGRFTLRPIERAALDSAFEGALRRHIPLEVPLGDQIWWNRFLPPDRQVDRLTLERRFRPL